MSQDQAERIMELPQATLFISGEFGKPMTPVYSAEEVRTLLATLERENAELMKRGHKLCDAAHEFLNADIEFHLTNPEQFDQLSHAVKRLNDARRFMGNAVIGWNGAPHQPDSGEKA